MTEKVVENRLTPLQVMIALQNRMDAMSKTVIGIPGFWKTVVEKAKKEPIGHS
jgi:hypothetical protein